MTKKAKSKTAQTSARAICIIAGKDKYLAGQCCSKLLDEILPDEEGRAMALFQPRSDKVAVSEVFDELRTLPFMAKRRVVLIKDADKFITDNRGLLERYFDKPSPSGTLILTVNSWPKNTKLAKKLTAMGSGAQLFEISEIKANRLPAFVIDYTRSKHGKNISSNTAYLLVEFAGPDSGRLASEIDKLAVFVDEEKTITAEHIEALIGHNRMFNAFGVIDAITAGNTAAAVGRLRNMFETDKNADYTTVGAFAYHFRRMFNAKAMLEKGLAQGQVASNLRIFYNSDAFFASLRRTTLLAIGDIIQQLGRIDYETKTGQASSRVAIEKLVLSLSPTKK